MTRFKLPALALIVAGVCVAAGAWSNSRTQPSVEADLQPVSLAPQKQHVYGTDGSTTLPDGVKIATTDGLITTVATTEGTPGADGWNDVIGTWYKPGSVDGTDVTRQLWRSVKLRIAKADGSIASVELARPLWWFEENDAHEVGDEVDLVLHELGIEGKATVVGIGPVDADSREGSSGSSIVTATIKHENATVFNLVFNELVDEPLGVTANHPIYSQDRDDWVPAGDLEIGEKVVAKDGFATLTDRSELPGRHTVYNLEVHRVHTFHVSDLGILVHNTCPGRFPDNPDDLLADLPRDAKGRIYPSDKIRIRPEKHDLKPGETYAPRHHGQHYHVETRLDPSKSWNNKKNVIKIKPDGYKPGDGTGFLPGEGFPGS